MEKLMTSNQEHLNTDIAGLTAAFAQVVAELKNQTGSGALDFTAADALVQSVQAEATADAPAPTPAPPVVTGAGPAVPTDPNAPAA